MDNSDKIEVLITKFLSGEASPEEAMQLEDWKNMSTQNLLQFNQSEKLFSLANQPSKKLNINQNKAWKIVQKESFKNSTIFSLSSNYKFVLGIAASIIIILSTYFIIQNQFTSNKIQKYTVAALQTEKNINLIDHTNIKIAAGSNIIYDENFGKLNRNLMLNGSASFTVKHNDTLPFIVDLGNVYVKDLGTKFNITLSADTDSIHINVDEGVVLLFDSSSNSIEIKASERAIYIKSSKQILKPTQQSETTLSYDKTPLSKVIAELQEKFTTIILLDNPKLSACTISAKFKDEDLLTILAVITETLGLTFEKKQDNFIIKGKACN